MGHLELLGTLPAANIFVGSVEHGAHKVNAFTVRHNGEGRINVAVFRGEAANKDVFARCAAIDFPFTIKDDYYEILVNKLIANAVINPLTALLQVKNGELVTILSILLLYVIYFLKLLSS